jgi:hypothetical protein
VVADVLTVDQLDYAVGKHIYDPMLVGSCQDIRLRRSEASRVSCRLIVGGVAGRQALMVERRTPAHSGSCQRIDVLNLLTVRVRPTTLRAVVQVSIGSDESQSGAGEGCAFAIVPYGHCRVR